MTRLIFVFVFACLATAPLPARAQQGAPATVAEIADKLAALEERIAAMSADAARAGSLAQTVADVDAELKALRQRVEVLAREQRSIPDARGRIDELSAAIAALGDDLGAVRDRVSALERGGGAGAGATLSASENRFVFRSADGRLSLEPTFFIQTRGQLDVTGAYEEVDALEVRLPRIRVGFWGYVGDPDLTFLLNIDPVDERALLDTFVQYRVADALSVRLGQTRVPFARGWLTPPFRFLFPERALATTTFRYDRDVQLTLLGELLGGRLAYRVSIGNGAGFNRRNQNTDLLASGRLELAVLGERVEALSEGDREHHEAPYLAVAVAANHNLVPLPERVAGIDVLNDVDGDGETDNVRVVSAGGEAQFKWRGFALTGEWFARTESYGTILRANPALRFALDRIDGDDATGIFGENDDTVRFFQGFYVQGSYFVVPRSLALGGRFGWSDELLLPFAGRNDRSAPPVNYGSWEVDGVVQWYWDRAGGRFLGLQYTYFNGQAEPGLDAVDAHRVLVESQFSF